MRNYTDPLTSPFSLSTILQEEILVKASEEGEAYSTSPFWASCLPWVGASQFFLGLP